MSRRSRKLLSVVLKAVILLGAGAVLGVLLVSKLHLLALS